MIIGYMATGMTLLSEMTLFTTALRSFLFLSLTQF